MEMDLGAACQRLKNITSEDWTTSATLILETWKYLTNHIQRSSLCKAESTWTVESAPRASRRHSAPPEPRVVHLQLVDEVVGISHRGRTVSPFSAVTDIQDSPTGTRRGSSSTHRVRPDGRVSKNNPVPTLSRSERALKNVQHNASIRHDKMGEEDVARALARRMGEFPPARAAGDVTGIRRHSIHRIASFLETFFAAMYIATRYVEFQKHLVRIRGKNRGKPRNVYEEFGQSLGIHDTEIRPVIKLGRALVEFCNLGFRGVLLLFDQPSTIRQLSDKNVAELGPLLELDPLVGEICQKLDSFLVRQYSDYCCTADVVWAFDKRMSEVNEIQKMMKQVNDIIDGKDPVEGPVQDPENSLQKMDPIDPDSITESPCQTPSEMGASSTRTTIVSDITPSPQSSPPLLELDNGTPGRSRPHCLTSQDHYDIPSSRAQQLPILQFSPRSSDQLSTHEIFGQQHQSGPVEEDHDSSRTSNTDWLNNDRNQSDGNFEYPCDSVAIPSTEPLCKRRCVAQPEWCDQQFLHVSFLSSAPSVQTSQGLTPTATPQAVRTYPQQGLAGSTWEEGQNLETRLILPMLDPPLTQPVPSAIAQRTPAIMESWQRNEAPRNEMRAEANTATADDSWAFIQNVSLDFSNFEFDTEIYEAIDDTSVLVS